MRQMRHALMLAAGLAAGLCARASVQPNIVVFLVDDMGLMDTSVAFCRDADGVLRRHPLNEWYRTPNMQRLADRGVRFTDFCAHSLCSPSRVSLMLGQNSARHRTTNWIKPPGKNTDDDPGYSYGAEEWNWEGVKKTDVTLPKLLKGAGYRTILVGKGHLGPFNRAGADPCKLGFDVNIGGGAIGQPQDYLGTYGTGQNQVKGLDGYYGSGKFLTEVLTIKALAEIDKCAEGKTPFFLYFSHYAVHSPFQSDSRFANNYTNGCERMAAFNRARAGLQGAEAGVYRGIEAKLKEKNEKAFSTMIEGMDESLGEVLDHLEEKGLAENTLVIFMGDNGSDAPLRNNNEEAGEIRTSAPLRGAKGTRWEGGVRVPGIVAWARPSAASPVQRLFPVAAGGVCRNIAAIYDVLPTCAALAGVPLPAGTVFDGISLWPSLAEPGKAGGHRTFLSYFPHSRFQDRYFATLRDGDWKIHRRYDPAGELGGVRHELYNLAADPGESNDLAASHPGRLAAMRAKLDDELLDYGALPIRGYDSPALGGTGGTGGEGAFDFPGPPRPPLGRGMTHYYDFETSHCAAGATEFTIEGKSWDAGESDWKADGGITLHAHCNKGEGIGAPALKKTGFGNAFSGGGTGAYIFGSDAPFLCPPTNGDWTIAFWALRYPKHDCHPVMLSNGHPVILDKGVAYPADAMTAASTDNVGFGFYALDGSANNANCRVGVRLSEKTVAAGGAGAVFTVKSIVSGGTLAWSNNEAGNKQENWHHILLVRAGTNLTLYLDGAAQGSAEMAEGSSVEVPEGGKLYTSRRAGGQAAGNALDDLAIWNRALGADEIALIATNGSPISRLARPERIVWTAEGGSGDWSAAGNWDLGRWTDGLATVFPSNAAGATAGAVRVDTNVSAASLVFAGSWALEGAGGSIALGGPVTVAPGAVAGIFAEVIGGLVKRGPGRLVIDPGAAARAPCSFAGPVTVRGGTLAAGAEFAADAAATFTNTCLRAPLAGGSGASLAFRGENTLGDGASFTGFASASFGAGSLTRIDGAVSLDGLGAAAAGEGACLAVGAGAALSYDFAIGTNLPAFTELGGTVTVTRCEMTPAMIRSGAAAAVAKAGPGVGAAAVAAAFRGTVAGTAGGALPAVFSLSNGVVTMRAGLDPNALTHTPGEDGAAFTWDKTPGIFDGAGTFADFNSVSFLEGPRPGRTAAVNVPERIRAGDVSIGPGYLFTGRAVEAFSVTKRGGGASSAACGLLAGDVAAEEGAWETGTVSAGAIAVSSGAVFRAAAVAPGIRALRLTAVRARDEGAEAAAVAELRLFRAVPGGFERFEWPAGTELEDGEKWCIYHGGRGTAGVSFSGTGVGAGSLSPLIDGVYAGCGFDDPYPTNASGGAASNKARLGIGSPVTITFPEKVPPPAGYAFCPADSDTSHPAEWTVEVSPDGERWAEAARVRADEAGGAGGEGEAEEPAFLLDYAAAGEAAAVTVAAGGTLVADGRWVADLTLEGGARLDARAAGARLELAGAVSLAAGAAVEVDAAGRALRNGERLVTWTGGAPEGAFTLAGCPGRALKKRGNALEVITLGTVMLIQ